ncbi:MAG TPA: hypothetical protein VG711_04395 [Phycisphaerales bacterium]|nr:hypothetical protein [Phycisphaerales bacterium]
MRLFSFWGDLNPWVQYGIALGLIGISTALYFSGILWFWGWAAGGVLLLFSGASDAKKRGVEF